MYLCLTCKAQFCTPHEILYSDYPAYNSQGELLGLEQEYLSCCPMCNSTDITEK